MKRRHAYALSCAIIFGATAPLLPAQSQLSTSPGGFSFDDLPVGRTDFTRYTTPSDCIAAARNARADDRHTIAAQAQEMIAAWREPDDSASGHAIDVARACGSKFTLASMTADNTPDMFDLAVLMHDDTLASAVAKRWFGMTTVPRERDSVAAVVAHHYLQSAPIPYSAVEALVPEAGIGSSDERHLAEMIVWSQLLDRAGRAFDRPRIRSYAERIRAIGRALPDSMLERKPWIVNDGTATGTVVWPLTMMTQAFRQLGAVEFVDAPDSLTALMRVAQTELGRGPQRLIRDSTLEWMGTWMVPMAVQHGEVVEPFTAGHWIPERPKSRGVTLIASLAASWGGTMQEHQPNVWSSFYCINWPIYTLNTTPFPDWCSGPETWIREWTTQYGSRGLNVIIAAQTVGSGFMTLALTPQQEAERFATYYRDQLHLPVAIGMVEVPMTVRPAPDNRRRYCRMGEECWQSAPALSMAQRQYLQIPITLLDADNHVLYRGDISPALNLILANAMKKYEVIPAGAGARQ